MRQKIIVCFTDDEGQSVESILEQFFSPSIDDFWISLQRIHGPFVTDIYHISNITVKRACFIWNNMSSEIRCSLYVCSTREVKEMIAFIIHLSIEQDPIYLCCNDENISRLFLSLLSDRSVTVISSKKYEIPCVRGTCNDRKFFAEFYPACVIVIPIAPNISKLQFRDLKVLDNLVDLLAFKYNVLLSG